ncbi:MAG: TetR/AcrR family transcriptional regulator [Pseudonocardiaceae bacterium]
MLIQAKKSSDEQQERTFTETARRAQIVQAAIETIAELGYARASFSRIAKRAGLSSTGLISYHFAGRDELMSEVVTEVTNTFTAFVLPRMQEQPTKAGELRAFVESNVDFMRTHRPQLVALLDIMASARDADGNPLHGAGVAQADVAKLAEFLQEGQQAGEFRRFDSQVMAVAIMSLRDGVLRALAADPGLDLDHYERELVTLVALATGKGPQR